MKTFILFGFITIFFTTHLSSQNHTNKGVFFELIAYKNKIERCMAYLINDTSTVEANYTDSDGSTKRKRFPKNSNTLKNSAMRDYFEIKTLLDASIEQFSYEMNRKKSLSKKFKKIDKHFKDRSEVTAPEALKSFSSELDEYVEKCNTFLKNYEGRPSSAGAMEIGVGDILDIVTLPWTIYKEYNEIMDKKVDSLEERLKQMKLQDIKSFMKDKE